MRRIIPIVLALLVLLPTVAQAAAWYRCTYDGRVRSRCCCPAEKVRHDHGGPAGMRALGCCKVTTPTVPDAPPRELAPVATHAPAPPAVIVVAASDVPDPRALRIVHATAIVPTGPPEPIFARNCTLLL